MLLAVALSLQLSLAPEGYRIAHTIALPGTAPRSARRLEILEDRRLTPEVLPRLGLTSMWFPDSSCAPLCASIAALPLRHAVIRVTDSIGGQLAADTISGPVANIAVERLRLDGERTYLVTFTLTGANSHDYTRFIEVYDTTLVTVGEVTADIRSSWRLAASDNGGRDILTVYGDWMDSTVTLVRYHFANGRWTKRERMRPGHWENGMTFPGQSEFP